MNLTYRKASVVDTEFARSLHHVAYRDVVTRQFGNWDEDLQNKFFADEWKPEQGLIVLLNGKPVGCCLSEVFGDHISLVELQILPEHQGQGIGSKVLDDLIVEAKKSGLGLRLKVLKQNRAQELYLRKGFIQSGETETHLLMELTGK